MMHENSYIIDTSSATPSMLSSYMVDSHTQDSLKRIIKSVVLEINNEETIKKMYRDILVNDYTFWQKLASNERLETRFTAIETRMEKTNKLLTENLLSKFRLELPTIVSEIIDKQITLKLKNELPHFLNNNMIMNEILLKHSDNLEKKLEKIVNEMVADDNFHVINRKYWDAFNAKSDVVIEKFKNDGRSSINEIKRQYDNDLAGLKTELETSKTSNRELNDRIARIEEKIKKTSDSSEIFAFACLGVMFAFGMFATLKSL